MPRFNPCQLLLTRWLLCLLVLACTGCSALLPDQYTFSRSELERSLARHFPADRRVLEVVDVQLSNPVLGFDPQRNRIALTVDADIRPPLIGRSFKASLGVNSKLRYDPANRSVLLDDPVVETFQLRNAEGTPVTGLPLSARQMNAIGALLAEQYLQGLAIHTFKSDALKVAGQRLEPTSITVLPDGVRVNAQWR